MVDQSSVVTGVSIFMNQNCLMFNPLYIKYLVDVFSRLFWQMERRWILRLFCQMQPHIELLWYVFFLANSCNIFFKISYLK